MAKTLTNLLGWVLLIVGIAGFFTGDMLLVFKVDPVHNIVHILSGLAALLAAAKGMSVLYLRVFGVVYGIVAVLGFMYGQVLDLMTVNTADNLLHLAIAAVSCYVGFTSKE